MRSLPAHTILGFYDSMGLCSFKLFSWQVITVLKPLGDRQRWMWVSWKGRRPKRTEQEVWKELTFKHSSGGSLDILPVQGDLDRASGLSLSTDFPLPGALGVTLSVCWPNMDSDELLCTSSLFLALTSASLLSGSILQNFTSF